MLELHVGKVIMRNCLDAPDKTDIVFQMCKGAMFRIDKIEDGSVKTTVLKPSMYPSPGSVIRIPKMYLTYRYFKEVPE